MAMNKMPAEKMQPGKMMPVCHNYVVCVLLQSVNFSHNAGLVLLDRVTSSCFALTFQIF